jgi:hypothetical protein
LQIPPAPFIHSDLPWNRGSAQSPAFIHASLVFFEGSEHLMERKKERKKARKKARKK